MDQKLWQGRDFVVFRANGWNLGNCGIMDMGWFIRIDIPNLVEIIHNCGKCCTSKQLSKPHKFQILIIFWFWKDCHQMLKLIEGIFLVINMCTPSFACCVPRKIEYKLWGTEDVFVWWLQKHCDWYNHSSYKPQQVTRTGQLVHNLTIFRNFGYQRG